MLLHLQLALPLDADQEHAASPLMHVFAERPWSLGGLGWEGDFCDGPGHDERVEGYGWRGRLEVRYPRGVELDHFFCGRAVKVLPGIHGIHGLHGLHGEHGVGLHLFVGVEAGGDLLYEGAQGVARLLYRSRTRIAGL